MSKIAENGFIRKEADLIYVNYSKLLTVTSLLTKDRPSVDALEQLEDDEWFHEANCKIRKLM